MELDFNEIRELLAVLGQTDISELTIKSEEFELTVRKNAPTMVGSAPPLPSLGVGDSAATALPAPPPLPSSPATPPAAPAVDPSWVEITSPMVGTFYRAPSPEDAPFVDVGDRIRSGQVVCILEAMKLMNELEAEIAGEIVEVLVENGEPVEYGQVLMRVRPD